MFAGTRSQVAAGESTQSDATSGPPRIASACPGRADVDARTPPMLYGVICVVVDNGPWRLPPGLR